MNESVWSVGLLAVLAVTRKWFKFSTAAIDGGEVGAAFLGSQGDVWDAQKDILCDTLGGAARQRSHIVAVADIEVLSRH